MAKKKQGFVCSAIAFVTAFAVMMLLSNDGIVAGMEASDTACSQLEDLWFNEFGCCETNFPACKGIGNAYEKAGCGILRCIPYFISSSFEASAIGDEPLGWTVDANNGQVTVVDSPVYSGDKSVQIWHYTDGGSTTKLIKDQGTGLPLMERVRVTAYMYPTVTNEWSDLSLYGTPESPGGYLAVAIQFTGGGYIRLGAKPGYQYILENAYVANTWYKIVFEADSTTDTITVWINDDNKGTYPFGNFQQNLGTIWFRTGNSANIFYVDDVTIEEF